MNLLAPQKLNPYDVMFEEITHQGVTVQEAALTTSSTVSYRSEKAGSRGHRRSLSLEDTGSSAAVMSPLPTEAAKPEKRSRKKGKRKETEPVVRKVMFVHVRINRFHCRGTYHVSSPGSICNRSILPL